MTGVPASAAGGSSGAQGASGKAATDGVVPEVSGSAPAPGSDPASQVKPARGGS